MSLLRTPGAGLVLPGVGVFLPEVLDDEFLGGAQGQGRQRHGVGTHVGDQTALIQGLRHAHRRADGEVQHAGGLLLERGGREGRAGVAGALLGVDVGDGIDGPDAVLKELFGIFKRVETAVQQRADLDGGGGPLRVEEGLHAVVGLALEVHDLLLAVHDQAQCDGLDAAGGKLGADLAPQDGGELESDQAVEHAAGLLGVDQVHVDLARVLDGVEHGGLGDLVECDAPGLGGIQFQGLGQVPGNRFSLAVLIGREPDRLCALGELLELGHHFFLVGRHDVFGRESVCDIDAQAVLLQVAYVADTGLDGVLLLVQEVPDGLGLFGRLDDD